MVSVGRNEHATVATKKDPPISRDTTNANFQIWAEL